MDKSELQQRTKQFALRVFTLVDRLPPTITGRAVPNQLVRSASSVGANYRAACRSRSRAKFAAKIGTVAEEADESLYWLELIREGGLVTESKIRLLLAEANELTAIFTESRRTASQNQTSKIRNQKLEP
jgi:four helix bundle protein